MFGPARNYHHNFSVAKSCSSFCFTLTVDCVNYIASLLLLLSAVCRPFLRVIKLVQTMKFERELLSSILADRVTLGGQVDAVLYIILRRHHI